MKDLPKIFHSKTNKAFNNNEKVFYSNSKNSSNIIKDIGKDSSKTESKNILQKINQIFSSPNYVYKANVEITLKSGKITKRIIGRNKDYIITMDNDLIPIVDVIDIKSIKE